VFKDQGGSLSVTLKAHRVTQAVPVNKAQLVVIQAVQAAQVIQVVEVLTVFQEERHLAHFY
jgi:hypothetical protein